MDSVVRQLNRAQQDMAWMKSEIAQLTRERDEALAKLQDPLRYGVCETCVEESVRLADQYRKEWDEARAWAEETVKKMAKQRIVTCVYCGHQFEDGTPTSQDARLTEHIRVCEKHPMREVEAQLQEARELLRRMIQACDDKHSICVCGGCYECDTRAYLEAHPGEEIDYIAHD